MKRIACLSACLIAIAFAGCAPYQSRFKVGGNSFVLPKDAKFDWMQVSIPTTNGPITLVISNAVFKMNPQVIDAKTAHDVAIANVIGDKVLQAASLVPK